MLTRKVYHHYHCNIIFMTSIVLVLILMSNLSHAGDLLGKRRCIFGRISGCGPEFSARSSAKKKPRTVSSCSLVLGLKLRQTEKSLPPGAEANITITRSMCEHGRKLHAEEDRSQ